MQYPACFLGALVCGTVRGLAAGAYLWRSSLSWCLRKAAASNNYSLDVGSEWVLDFAFTHVNEGSSH